MKHLAAPLVLLATALVSDARADAAGRPKGNLTAVAITNAKYATVDYYAGYPLKLALSGTGSCHMKIAVETREGATVAEREYIATLPDTYVSTFNLPPYGPRNGEHMTKRDYRVHVAPVVGRDAKTTCTGVAVTLDIRTSCQTGAGGSPERCEPTSTTSHRPDTQRPDPAQSSGGGAGGAGGGGAGAPAAKPLPAKGTLTAISVPSGSFAVDDVQKLQVAGTGACGFDLQISNKTYGGSYDKTWDVLPVTMGATLLEGSHFGKLAEGSYFAKATGKGGCTGSAQIDFKVTAPNNPKTVTGQPSLGFDKAPLSGDAYSTKDSNIWFSVSLPSGVKAEPSVTCCQVQFDFKNAYGGWEPAPNMPYDDAAFSLAASQPKAVAPKSVSAFKEGTEWRVRMRALKYKTNFEWSDWQSFKTAP